MTREDVIADDHLVYPVPGEPSSELSGVAIDGQCAFQSLSAKGLSSYRAFVAFEAP